MKCILRVRLCGSYDEIKYGSNISALKIAQMKISHIKIWQGSLFYYCVMKQLEQLLFVQQQCFDFGKSDKKNFSDNNVSLTRFSLTQRHFS